MVSVPFGKNYLEFHLVIEIVTLQNYSRVLHVGLLNCIEALLVRSICKLQPHHKRPQQHHVWPTPLSGDQCIYCYEKVKLQKQNNTFQIYRKSLMQPKRQSLSFSLHEHLHPIC